MANKVKAYYIAGILFIIAGIISILNHAGSIKYALITVGICLLVYGRRVQTKDVDDPDNKDDKKQS